MARFIKDLFIPSIRNNSKAYLLHANILIPVFVILFLINFVASINYLSGQKVLGAQSDLTEAEIISLTNLERAKAGVNLLKPNPQLNLAAQNKAESMVAAGVFQHYYETKGQMINPWQFITDAGYDYFHAGENLGKDFQSSQKLVQAWMDSPSHRDNLLDSNYQDIGVAVVEGPYLDKKQTTLVVQLFATSMSAANAPLNIKPSDPDVIKLAPLLENDTSWTKALLAEYPVLTLAATGVVTVLIGITMLIEIKVSKKKLRSNNISIDLWSH